MATRRSDSSARRQPLDRRRPQLRALRAPAVGRLRLICGVHRAMQGHLVTDLVPVLFDRTLASEFADIARRLARRHWSPMA